jgi:hypothetical protein
MSLGSDFTSGFSTGQGVRDRYYDRKKRTEDIKLQLEKEERQKAFEREMKAEALKADLQKMGFGGELDLTKLKAQLTGQGELAAADRSWRSGESAADRNWRTGEASTDRSWRSGEAAQDRGQRQQQIDNALAGQNAELGLRNSAQGWDMSPANPRNQGRPDRSKMAQVKRILEDGAEATYDVPVEEFNQPPAPPGPGQGELQQAIAWAKANPNDPRAKRILQLIAPR